MGLFSRTQKPNPKLIVDGIEVTFQREHDWWDFTYKGIEFSSYESGFTLPSKVQLDSVVNTIESLMAEMRSRIQKELNEWGISKLDDGETFSVNLRDFAADGTFMVTWSEGKSWGDLAVDFTVKDAAIIDESWGD